MAELPDTMSAHMVSDSLENAIFTVLLDKCGEDIAGTRSINSNKAVVGLMAVAAQLMARWSKKARRSFIRSFEEATDNLALRLRREYAERANAPPQ